MNASYGFLPQQARTGRGLGIAGLILSIVFTVLGILLVLLIIETYQERRGSFREWLEERSPFVQWLFIVVPLVLMYFLAIDRSDYIAPEFIYKQF